MSGHVILAGAGPGDPGLLTLHALEAIRNADVILYDQLVDPRIRELFPEKAELLFVGKEGGLHHVTQDQTMELIVTYAKKGKTILRLKGGDPFVFGRGGEEAEVCVKEKIPFEVIPGITAGVAGPAYAGIPITHRDASASLAFVTGHRRNDQGDLELAAPQADTLVYYMGVKNLPAIRDALLASGRDKDTPVALIHRGTTPKQRTLVATLNDIVERAREKKFKPPSLVVVGKVVTYQHKLSWFETKPLFNRTFLITRPKHQSGELQKRLEQKGAHVISMPAIEIKKLEDCPELDKALSQLNTYHYLVFTSVNGVGAFFDRLFEKGYDARNLNGLSTVCIGSRTAKELESFHVKCDLMPKKFVAEELLKIFPKEMTGKRVLIPRALEAREILPQGLRDRGAYVNVAPAYQTRGVERKEGCEKAHAALFTSSSAAEHFIKRNKLPLGCKVASIGPITSQTLRDNGLSVDMEAKEYSIPGLVQAIEEYFTGEPG